MCAAPVIVVAVAVPAMGKQRGRLGAVLPGAPPPRPGRGRGAASTLLA
ncbi:hypothetical protein HMPREF1550_01997 [Actinomyces sp. oral taxon 877 str. F0543]|nr:hypothetical protein HMPREF1550_01997 [Actinomyces sp. oral taxon 877 str. F0543]